VTGSRTLTARVIPPPLAGAGGASKMLERNWIVYKHMWSLIISGFFEPLFYLFSIGVGIGVLVGDGVVYQGTTIRYVAFLAPALMAATAMNGAIYESTFNIFFKLRYGKVYDGILATPMRPRHIAIGEITWSLGRGVIYAIGFIVVMLFMGLIESPWAILAIPGAVLIGFAFAACGMAATTFMKSWQDFDLVSMVTLPLFLFSGTFYPTESLPPTMQTVVQFSPLYHGAELLRSLILGSVGTSDLGHVAFLVGMGLVGGLIAGRRLQRLLLS
jgi:lipooligosaccharide transport system permease protein